MKLTLSLCLLKLLLFVAWLLYRNLFASWRPELFYCESWSVHPKESGPIFLSFYIDGTVLLQSKFLFINYGNNKHVLFGTKTVKVCTACSLLTIASSDKATSFHAVTPKKCDR